VSAGKPLLITAELPGAVLAWADALRRAHYPPEKNRLRAHVTLFHALPPSAEGEIRRLLAELAKGPPPDARITGVWDMGRGTALDVTSEGMAGLHAQMAERFHGLLGWQDDRKLRLHVTVQNKVSREAAEALQSELEDAFELRTFRFHGFGIYAWDEGLWQPIADYAFRG
jgi:hypothetical protein